MEYIIYGVCSRREEIYQQYKPAKLLLLNVDPEVQPVRYQAILRTTKQQEIVQALAKHNISAVVPIREAEIIEPQQNYQML